MMSFVDSSPIVLLVSDAHRLHQDALRKILTIFRYLSNDVKVFAVARGARNKDEFQLMVYPRFDICARCTKSFFKILLSKIPL
jgi:hypothetical protein